MICNVIDSVTDNGGDGNNHNLHPLGNVVLPAAKPFDFAKLSPSIG